MTLRAKLGMMSMPSTPSYESSALAFVLKKPAKTFLPRRLSLGRRARWHQFLSFSGQTIEITGPTCTLLRRNWRNLPRHIHQVEELRHIHLHCIALRQRRQFEPRPDELENRGVVGHCVRDVVLLCEWRHHNQRHAVSRVDEIARRSGVGRRADVAWLKVSGWNIVGTHSWLRRNMIIKSAKLVEGQNKRRVFPRRAQHQRVDQRLHVLSALLNVGWIRHVDIRRMLVEGNQRCRLNHSHLWQTSALHVR